MHADAGKHNGAMKSGYGRFAMMIATSTVVMFGLMYLNTYSLDDVFWSQTRAWMALLMGAVMAIVMMAFMRRMYPNRSLNIAIIGGSVVVAALSLWLVRSQATVGDVSYMKAMIPHHSIAVMTSSRASLTDPRVRRLAHEIVAAQRKEIAEMRYLVEDIGEHGEAQERRTARTPPAVLPARDAIAQARIETTDLDAMDRAEVARVLGRGAYCEFRYARDGEPVVGLRRGPGAVTGVAKVHGRLVPLRGSPGGPGGTVLVSPGLRIVIDAPQGEPSAMQDAVARLHLDGGLDVGYAGFYTCASRG